MVKKPIRICSYQGCKEKHFATGFCRYHYKHTPKYKKYQKEYTERTKKKRSEYFNKYYNSSEGRKRIQDYNQRVEVKKRKRKYQQTDEAKKRRKERDNSPEGRTKIQAYNKSDKVKKKKFEYRQILSVKKKRQETSRKWNEKNKVRISVDSKKKRLENTRIVISKYTSEKMNCKLCGLTGLEFLEIDHIHGRKNAPHPKGYKGDDLKRWIIQNNFPKDIFQVLCGTCNLIKSLKQKESLRKHTLSAIRTRKSNLKTKITVLSHYSRGDEPSCTCCGFDSDIRGLTIDHKKPRKEYGHGDKDKGEKLYRLLKRDGFPPGFQTLCQSCNQAKKNFPKCPHQK